MKTSYAKNKIKSTILRFIAEKEQVSRNDIIKELGFSLPTVLQKVNELTEDGLIAETGQSESNGGRKAKLISLLCNARYAVGVNITAHHVETVIIGLDGTMIASERSRLVFKPTLEYCQEFYKTVNTCIEKSGCEREKITGMGIALPGFVDKKRKILLNSRAFQIENYSLKELELLFPYPVIFENDANAAAFAEKKFRADTAFYLSLSTTVGGAFSVDGKMFEGKNHRSSEIGHVVLIPQGKPCYCGKKGCIDSYCSTKVLAEDNLQEFFERVKHGEKSSEKVWMEYLEHLALVISNLRYQYDCDIIVGGHIGGYLEPYLPQLRQLTLQNDRFDSDATFIHCGKYGWEASAYGIAYVLIDQFLSEVI